MKLISLSGPHFAAKTRYFSVSAANQRQVRKEKPRANGPGSRLVTPWLAAISMHLLNGRFDLLNHARRQRRIAQVVGHFLAIRHHPAQEVCQNLSLLRIL